MGNNSYSYRSIKGKLVAATCMLLVSCIMVVSSTYAWFTLSTAPEVTGIQTAVGANGNLEMALLPEEGGLEAIKSSVGDGMAALKERNTTWGNLVALKDDVTDIYGMSNMVLYPAALNVATWDNEETKLNPATLAEALLSTPEYGADGRVTVVKENTTTSTYNTDTTNFPGNDFSGVRAVGVSSGMTDRQLAYRNHRSAANTAMAQAKTFASQSLNNNGDALANIAIKKAMSADSTYTKDDVDALKAIVNDLLGTSTTNDEGEVTKTTGVLDYIETAYVQYIKAYVASKANTVTDTEWSAMQSSMSSATTIEELKDIDGLTIPDPIDDYVGALADTRQVVEIAKSELDAITAEDGITWSSLSIPMNRLAKTDAMKINGYEVDAVKDNLGAIVSSVTEKGGLTVTMASGGGVYADIADHCGDYTASISIDKVEYNGIVLNNMKARMETKTTVTSVYLVAVGTVVDNAKAPDSDTTTSQPLTDMYGYIIDLAFRTNAADSDLLLQTEAKDRIYSDNSNEDTMGAGSTMTFTATTTDFTDTQIKKLMESIRVVFFTPGESNRVLATAKLDTENATTVGGNSVTAQLYLYEKGSDGTETLLTGNNAVITPMAQNTPTAVSVLVYLDGEKITNADVAATGSSSATGTMNLQFASSANLQPMEYKDLHIAGESSGNDEESGTQGATTYNVTRPTGVNGAATATPNTAYDFTVTEGTTLDTVTVGGTEVTPTNNGNGSHTIPAASVTGDIVITVTSTT